MAKIDELLETIDSLTVVELSELVKGIEEKYGVSAVAAAAPAAGAVAGGAAEEKSRYLHGRKHSRLSFGTVQ